MDFGAVFQLADALYFADGANLYTLNTTTGAATLIGNLGGPEIGALVMEGGVLYGGENTPALAVATLNPLTGVATTGSDVTGTGAGVFFALAPNPLPVAEPSTWSMIAVGALALLGIMLRKKRRIG